MIDRKAPTSLWHGTSSLLMPSIIEHGLGASNPLNTLRLVEFLRLAVDYVDYDEMNFDDPYYCDKAIISKTARQCSRGMNFQHGHTYVTGDRTKAEVYAQTAPESVNMVRTMMQICSPESVKKIQVLLDNYHDLKTFLDTDSSPVLLEIRNISVSDLAHENGQDIDERKSALSKRTEPIEHSPIFGNMAFRLIRVLPFRDLTLYEPTEDGLEFTMVEKHNISYPMIGMTK